MAQAVITLIDYGMGNLGSLENMIRKAGGESSVASTIGDIEKASKLVLPGVGHFDNAMKKLNALGFAKCLRHKVIQQGTPVLCICLGAQLATQSSEEGTLPGLGWVNAKTIRFNFQPSLGPLKIPHMGWNDVKLSKSSRLFDDMYPEPCFYFVHSFHLHCYEPFDVLTTTHYGYEFVSALEKNNIYAMQFHPEKSHKYGLKIISNFLKI
jgi:glutamine amidotransferase